MKASALEYIRMSGISDKFRATSLSVPSPMIIEFRGGVGMGANAPKESRIRALDEGEALPFGAKYMAPDAQPRDWEAI